MVCYFTFARKTECFRPAGEHTASRAEPYLPQLLLRERKGVHEGLGDDGQTAIDVGCLLNVKDKLRVLQDVHPEAKREAVPREKALFKQSRSHEVDALPLTVCKRVFLSLSLK